MWPGMLTFQHTCETLEEKIPSPLECCDAHEIFREYAIEFPQHLLGVLNHLKELCQLLDVTATARSTERVDDVESMRKLIYILVEQHHNATTSSAPLGASRTTIEQGQEELSNMHLAQSTGGSGASGERLMSFFKQTLLHSIPRIRNELAFGSPWKRTLEDLACLLALLSHAYEKFERPFVEKVGEVTSTMANRLDALAKMMQESAEEENSANSCEYRGNPFRRLREASFLQGVEKIHFLTVDGLERILTNQGTLTELAVIE
ncbi:hypothetical protein Pmar_PMAR001359 [Perkinsus marinus ATCC 50983]|uniref:Uncharacterized protein n=1 Tax=Perkinsus marinus (strain ATCC 50983 / TXsc) TaxID=423536 RepID=C5KJH6_PERM5|nr:hypothetical protein Pmar_PMAR001359 [Perkinsus marinus ATCC 50983]EER15310.1 hypothetical protein Pmar_PMAR001359 [Perkinsus marinus ATCC 50983]|eukprot:XP_002783514.1 hypothetical protein Pmar_PMAR001359 [Perkinsus marinus ATCC 50983]